MFFEFDDSVINANAISQLVRLQSAEEYKIIALRADGSYMASESFSTEAARETRMSDILNKFTTNNILI